MSDNFSGVTRELTNVLMEYNLQSQKRLVETCAAMEHYVSRFQSVEKSIQYQKDLIEKFNEKSLSTTKIFEKINASRLKFFIICATLTLIITVVFAGSAGFFFAYTKSEELYFKDKRYQDLKQSIDDVDLLKRLRKKNFFISEEAIFVPPDKIAKEGWADDYGKGFWLKK